MEWPESQNPWLLGYNVYVQLPGGKRFELVNHAGLIKGNKYMVKGLAYGVTYIVRITAVTDNQAANEKTVEVLAIDVPLP